MRNIKSIAALVIALFMFSIILVPASNASNISVYLNPQTNSAEVNAYVNSTLTVEVSNASFGNFLISLLNDTTSGQKYWNESFPSNSTVFSIVQSAIKGKLSNANLSYLTVNLSRSGELLNNTTFVLHHSLQLSLAVTGIFSNSTANMSWRSFIINHNVSVSHQSINYVNVGKVNLSGNNSVLNFSAFKTSLKTWKSFYNDSDNTTTFSYDAGTTQNIHANLSLFGSKIKVSLTTDPSYSIVAPGKAVATDNGIVVNYVQPSKPISPIYVVVAVILIGGALVSLYTRRRRRL